jgi:hypothetical protein
VVTALEREGVEFHPNGVTLNKRTEPIARHGCSFGSCGKSFIDRGRNSVNGVEVDAGPRDTALVMLRAAMTLAGIALRQ